MELQPRPYLFEVRQRLDPEVHAAFYECFRTAAGHIVLDYLYWQVMMADPKDARDVGGQDLVRKIVYWIQQGARERGVFSLYDAENQPYGNGHPPQ